MKDGMPSSLFHQVARPEPHRPGVLPSQEIAELVDNGKICSSERIADEQIQPASIDLRLGRIAYQVQASFLPSRASTISARIKALQVAEIDLSEPAVLSRGRVFIIPLVESVSLPKDMYGKANPKSTTGRLDVFTRLMTDGGTEFEEVPAGYRGNLYVEVVPRTFSIVVRAGTRLNQLRFWRGTPLRDDEYLKGLDRKQNLVYYEGRNGTHATGTDDPSPANIGRGLQLTVDLEGSDNHSVIAYRAKGRAEPIDLSKVGEYDASDYWDAITRPKSGRLVLQPGAFYLLASKERLSVPSDHAAEMEQYDPSLGEFSVHYAGFFDPGFGYGTGGEVKGTRAVLEVRAHEVPILLEDGQTVGRLNYFRMARIPDKLYGQGIGSSYQKQGLALSKQFRTTARVRLAAAQT